MDAGHSEQVYDNGLQLTAPLRWRSRCGGHGSCVEVADLPSGGVAVRDSKVADSSPILVFDSTEWSSFVAGVKAGEFG